MSETRTEFKARLKQEGRWDAFVDHRTTLRDQGMSASEANAIARAEFAPGTGTDTPSDKDDSVVDNGDGDDSRVCADTFADKPPVSARKVVQWVFNHIDVEDIGPEDAPSAGAWSLLIRLRKFPDLLKEFYRTIWAKMLPTRSEIEATEKFEDDGRQQLDIIDKLRRAARQEDKQ